AGVQVFPDGETGALNSGKHFVLDAFAPLFPALLGDENVCRPRDRVGDGDTALGLPMRVFAPRLAPRFDHVECVEIAGEPSWVVRGGVVGQMGLITVVEPGPDLVLGVPAQRRAEAPGLAKRLVAVVASRQMLFGPFCWDAGVVGYERLPSLFVDVFGDV